MGSWVSLAVKTGKVGGVLLGLLAQCWAAGALAAPAAVDEARILSADLEPGNWLSHGRTYDEQRFSPLTQINSANVAELGLAWSLDLGTKRGLEATPLVIDGVMYFTGNWSVVYAVDARTGQLLWQYDPQVEREWAFNSCCDVVNRGVAAWQGKIYVGTLDGRLVAIDAGSGQKVWETLTIDKSWPYTITGAPRIVKGKVIIGNGGAEMGVRGYVSAYDAITGEMVWRFYTVPGNPGDGFENEAMAKAAATWTGEWWNMGGGGTVWDSMAYDPELDLLYVGVGNGGPWNQYVRSPGGGDNLYVSSILALRPDTGEYVWHYQETPGDRWDYTATQHMALADLDIGGATRKVLMQAPKNGFFYVLDRVTGKLISAEPYVTVNWASHIDLKTGRPVETEVAHYRDKTQKTYPTMIGGHNWHPSSFSPQTGFFYIPAIDQWVDMRQEKDFVFRRGMGTNAGVPMAADEYVPGLLEEVALESMFHGQLVAWDPVRQKAAWRVHHGSSWNAGVLSTAGNLVFQGSTLGHMVAYDASTGVKLWDFPTHIAIMAAPVTYTLDGEQYVAVLAGWGGALGMASKPKMEQQSISKGQLLVWKLGGKATLPAPETVAEIAPYVPDVAIDHEKATRGRSLYNTHCSRCHGLPSRASGVVPDLGRMSKETHDLFDAIVLGGLYYNKGMKGFGNQLNANDSDAIHHYLIARAAEKRDEMQAPSWWVSIKRWFFTLLMGLMN